jgi:hypothetical protein
MKYVFNPARIIFAILGAGIFLTFCLRILYFYLYMKEKSILIIYLKSNLNLVLMLVTLALLIITVIFGTGIERAYLSLGVLVLYAIVTTIIFFSKRGAKEIVGEQEKERIAKLKEKILYYKQMRDRISFLRIGDKDVKNTLDYFLVTVGNCLNKCSEVSSYSPEANRRIEEILDICQVYLEKLDQSSLDVRYKMEDKEFADYKERTIASINDASNSIKNKITGELIGLTPEEKMEIIEEINKEQ